MDYKIYHDESLCSGFWHGIFLVPVSQTNQISNLIKQARDQINYHNKIKFSDITGPGEKYELGKCLIEMSAAFLQ